MQTEQIIGILAGIFTTLAVLPQIYKALKSRKVNDVSPLMFLILCLGVGLWTVYGILKQDWPIIVTNGLSSVLNAMMLLIVITQKKDSN